MYAEFFANFIFLYILEPLHYIEHTFPSIRFTVQYIKYAFRYFHFALYFWGVVIVTNSIWIYTTTMHAVNTVPSLMLYDYVIVGAGTAGLTIFNELKKNNASVLVIEAGYMPLRLMDIPVLTPLIHQTDFNWKYESSYQMEAGSALNNKKSRISAGKGVGGGNILNNMISHWGHREDFRGWFNDPEDYDYETDILPYFEALKDFPPVHNLQNLTELGKTFAYMKQFEKVKFEVPKLAQKNGARWTLTHEVLRDSEAHKQIWTGATVTKLVFAENTEDDDCKNLRTNGVEVLYRQTIKHIFAKKGIILSAGAIGTPNILMQSGIGSRENLRSVGIKCVRDLPVGRNLQDHISTGFDLVRLNVSLGMNPISMLWPGTLWDYFKNGIGPLTSAGCESLGFLENNGGKLPPDLGFMVLPLGITADLGVALKNVVNINSKWWEKYFQVIVNEGYQTVSIMPVLLRPRSRGYMKLVPTKSKPSLRIFTGYLTDDEDVELFITGLQLLSRLVDSPDLQRLGAKIIDQPFPDCEAYDFKSYSYWRCYVRHLTLTVYHPAGTCRMGNAGDLRTVVGRNFKVLGTSNLYVVDASLFPNIPSGNPNSIVAMTAKKFLAGFNLKSKFYSN